MFGGDSLRNSVARVAELMEDSEWGVRQALKRKRLRFESVLIDNKMRVVVPLSAMVEYWNLPASGVHLIESDARQHARVAPVQLVKRLAVSVSGGVGGDSRMALFLFGRRQAKPSSGQE